MPNCSHLIFQVYPLVSTIRQVVICQEGVQFFCKAQTGQDIHIGHEDKLGEGGAAGEVAHVGLGVGVDRAPSV